MAKKTQHYTVDNKNKIVRAYIARLTEKEKKEIKNYLDLGYTLIAEEEPVKRTLTKEERDKLQLEFDELYNKILDGFDDWDYSTLDRLLEVHLKLNQD